MKRRLDKIEEQALAQANAEKKLAKQLKKTEAKYDAEEDASIAKAINHMVICDMEHAFFIKSHCRICDHWWHHKIVGAASVQAMFKDDLDKALAMSCGVGNEIFDGTGAAEGRSKFYANCNAWWEAKVAQQSSSKDISSSNVLKRLFIKRAGDECNIESKGKDVYFAMIDDWWLDKLSHQCLCNVTIISEAITIEASVTTGQDGKPCCSKHGHESNKDFCKACLELYKLSCF